MKAIKFLAMMLAGAALLFGTTACGDDDEPYGGSTTSITVNGTTFKVDHAYWSATYVENENPESKALKDADKYTWYGLYLYNCDVNNIKDPWHAITIIYQKEGLTDLTTFADGTYKDFEVSLSILTEDDDKDVIYYGHSQDDGNDATLTVSHDGGLSVNVSAMKYEDEDGVNTYPGAAFSYKGSVKQMPTTGK